MRRRERRVALQRLRQQSSASSTRSSLRRTSALFVSAWIGAPGDNAASLVALLGFVETAQHLEKIAEVVVRRRESWRIFNRLAIGGLSLGDPSGPCEQIAEVKVRLRHSGLQRQRHTQAALGLVGSSLTVVQQSQLHAHRSAPGVGSNRGLQRTARGHQVAARLEQPCERRQRWYAARLQRERVSQGLLSFGRHPRRREHGPQIRMDERTVGLQCNSAP